MSYDQLEMFSGYLQYEEEDGIVCKKCGVRQPPENFQHMESGEVKRKCRACQKKHSQTISRLNSGLGSFSDSVEIVKRAVIYLEAHENEISS